MSTLDYEWTGDGIVRMNRALEQLASPRRLAGFRSALNDTGDKVYTQVRSKVSKYTGAPVRKIEHYGAMRKVVATDARLEYLINSTGRGIPLKVFKARQLKRGVSVFAWGKRYKIPRGFMIESLGSNIFMNTRQRNSVSGRNNAIKKLTGASIPKELVKTYVVQVFQQVVSTSLPPRVEHYVEKMTQGVISR